MRTTQALMTALKNIKTLERALHALAEEIVGLDKRIKELQPRANNLGGTTGISGATSESAINAACFPATPENMTKGGSSPSPPTQPRADVCNIVLGSDSAPLDRYKEAVRVKIADILGDAAAEMFGARIPDYPNDLNACHEWEEKLTEDEQQDYAIKLKIIMPDCGDFVYISDFYYVHATALQRCEARILMEGK